MAHQTTMNRGAEPSLGGAISELGELGNNIVVLATLQAKLAAQDARESTGRAIPAIIGAAIALPLALASATIAVFGTAYWIADAWNIPIARAMLIVAVIGIVVSSVLAVLAIYRFRVSLLVFRRSREELERNLAWLGTVLLHSGPKLTSAS